MFVCNTPRPTQLSISVRSHSGPARAYALQLGLYLYLEETYKKFGIYRQNLVPFLNHLDDAVPPESDTAREFGGIAKRIASGEATPNDWQRVRQWLLLWRDNDAKLQPLLKRSYLTQDLAPVSENLSRAAEIGLGFGRSGEKPRGQHSRTATKYRFSKIRRQTAGRPAPDGGAIGGTVN
jgi:hypothetical protein